MNNTETINMSAADLITLKYTIEANEICGGGAGYMDSGGAAVGIFKNSIEKNIYPKYDNFLENLIGRG